MARGAQDLLIVRPGGNLTLRRRWVIGLVVAAVAIVLTIPSIITFVTWRTPVWWTNPPTLHWCGRDYSKTSGYVQESHVAPESLLGSPVFPLKKVGVYPPWSGHAIIARLVPPQWESYRAHSGIACAGALYLESPGHGYIMYSMVGGP
jgi:hypothetical protein